MTPYKEMYYHLFNAVTDALRAMAEQDSAKARILLESAQQWCESTYIENTVPEFSDKE